MRRRWERVRETPRLVGTLLRRRSVALWERRRHRPVQLAFAGLLAVAWLWSVASWWEARTPSRAAAAYAAGDFNRSAELFESLSGAAARFNAANARYRSGAYERAFALYDAVRSADPDFKAAVYYNEGNTLVRLKEFKKARDAYRKSLALREDPQARENLLHILEAEEQDHMLTGRQEGKKRATDQEGVTTEQGNKKRKEGGGSNQRSQADRHRGGGERGKKVQREMQLDFSSRGGHRLSSKQYELINQRSVHETNPW